MIVPEGEVCTKTRRGGGGKNVGNGPRGKYWMIFHFSKKVCWGLVMSSSKKPSKNFLDLCAKIPLPNIFFESVVL